MCDLTVRYQTRDYCESSSLLVLSLPGSRRAAYGASTSFALALRFDLSCFCFVSATSYPRIVHLVCGVTELCRTTMMSSLAFILATLALHSSFSRARQTCQVASSVAGKDAGPAILSAFQTCGKGGKILLDGYYLVDTVLQTTGNGIEIELSGTLQFSTNITKWSNTSIFLAYQVRRVHTFKVVIPRVANEIHRTREYRFQSRFYARQLLRIDIKTTAKSGQRSGFSQELTSIFMGEQMGLARSMAMAKYGGMLLQ